MDLKLKDVIVLTILFSAALWLWTLPIQENPLPFGEHDGAFIFATGDHIAYTNKAPDVIGGQPPSLRFWYPAWNKALGPTAIEYPPSYIMDYAFAQIFGGQRVVPVYIFIALGSFLGIFSMYLLMRKLYGFEAALITSTALLFSYREILLYLWGQRHNVIAFTFIPIAIFALYKYLDSFYGQKEKMPYLYIFVLLALCTFLTHFSSSVFIIPYTFVLITLMSIKNKKFPLSKNNLKHYVILAILIFIVVFPFYLIYFGPKSTDVDLGIKDLGSLFYWLKIPDNNFDMNPIFNDYNSNYMGYWTIPLLLIGLLILLLKRDNKSLVILSALITLYILFHLSAFGLTKPTSYRIGRYLILESYFFYSTMAIAIISLPSLFKIPRSYKNYVKLGLSSIFIVFLITIQGTQAYDSLKNAYPSIARVTSAQYEFAEWVDNSIPEDSALHIMGTITYAKKGFIQILSRRVMDRDDYNPGKRELRNTDIIQEHMIVPKNYVDGTDWFIPIDYVIFDYSDLALINDQARIALQNSQEQEIFNSSTLIYDKNNIRVYKFD